MEKEKNKPIVSEHTGEREDKQWWANCPKCGALIYATCGAFALKEVLTVERPYCPHCGLKVDASKIDTNENHYCNCN